MAREVLKIAADVQEALAGIKRVEGRLGKLE